MKNCALIVTFNRLDKLKQCLDASIIAGFDTILIINNGSTDGTAEWLKDYYCARIVVLSLPVNIGGAGGFSYGLNYVAQCPGIDWVFLYDDDAYPVANILNRFANVRQQYEYDAYCGKVVDRMGRVCRINQPFIRFPATLWEEIRYVFERRKFVADNGRGQLVSSFSFVGAVLHKKFIARNLEGLYPELFIYFDDVYFSYSSVLKGEKIFYFPDAVFIHDLEADNKLITPEWKVYYLMRNMLLAKKIFMGRSPFGWLTITLRIISYSCKFFNQRNKLEYIKFLLKGVWHGLLSRTGGYR